MGSAGNRDLRDVAGVLTTANAMFKRYRGATKTEELYKELKYVLDTFAKPLLELTLELSAGLEANVGNAYKPPRQLLMCLRLAESSLV